MPPTLMDEILSLEEDLRQAELAPDPAFFDRVLRDDTVFVTNGQVSYAKPVVLASHQPGAGPKFRRVEMSDLKIVDHGDLAIVTCEGTYENDQSTFTLKFMRVWAKPDGRWQIVAAALNN
jgi:hypothetical protein